jgi:hypothetical protein
MFTTYTPLGELILMIHIKKRIELSIHPDDPHKKENRVEYSSR